ncbi:MAG: serine hydrolase domain-containing protein [Pseudohongiellaceae bacterium]
MRKCPGRLPVLLAGLLLAWPVAAMDPVLATANPRPLPQYNYDFSEYIDWVQHTAGERGIPGAALAIVSREGVRHLYTWGVKELGEEESVSVDSVFRIASMSKTFAGAAATLVVNEQLHSWDTPLTQLLPGLAVGPPGSSRAITLRHVASHSTGLMPHSYSNLLDAGVEYERIKDKFTEIPSVCAPGNCYGYQNVVFSLIADVVEQSTGDSYAHYLEAKLFQPLGMVTASVGLEPYLTDDEATAPHRRVRGRWSKTSTNPAYYSAAPAAGINASVYDMTLWLRANLGAFPDVLPADSLSEMHNPVIETPYGNYFNRWSGLEKAYYGIGWRVFDFRGVRAIHHGGGVRGYRSEMVFVPEANIGMVLLFNGEEKLANDVVPTFLDYLTSSL